jgi:hemolysin D
MDGVASELHASNAEVDRREAVVSEVRTWLPDGLFSNRRDIAQGELAFPTDTPNDVIAREQRIYNADLAQLDAAVKNIAAQRDQQQSTIERLTQTIAAQRRLVETLGERVTLFNALIDRSVGTKVGLIDAMRPSRKSWQSLLGRSTNLRRRERQ